MALPSRCRYLSRHLEYFQPLKGKILSDKSCFSKRFSTQQQIATRRETGGINEAEITYLRSKGTGDNRWKYTGYLCVVFGSLGFTLYAKSRKSEPLCQDGSHQPEAGKRRPDLPDFRLRDINEHRTKDRSIWVTYKEGVYDVTDYVAIHPGGENIMLASGAALEPFWLMYAMHQNPEVYAILEGLRIGNVHPEDMEHHRTILKENIAKLESNIDRGLEVSGVSLREPINLNVNELRKQFKQHTVVATIKCASKMSGGKIQEATTPDRDSDQSDSKTVTEITWTGVKLIDVVNYAKVDKEKVDHVVFQSTDRNIKGVPFETSVPAKTAFDPHTEVILAYEMNGRDIPLGQGHPLRLVIPGARASKQVKRLAKVILTTTDPSRPS